MKFVIFKGIEGFCDRLQCLLYVMMYSKKTGRILVIDWTDREWCHNKELDFSHYFYLKDINYLPLKSFLNLYCIFLKNNIELSIYPKVWEKKLFLVNQNIYEKSYLLLNDENAILTDINEKRIPDFEQDIVVYSGVKKRDFTYSLFYEHFRIKKFILERIYQHSFYKKIISNQKPYICVHLRGGDRMVKDVTSIYFNNSYNIESYLDDIENKINFNLRDVLIISDSQKLINKFIKRNNNRNLKFYTTNNYKAVNGLHKLSKEHAEISKEEINIQMLIDFYFYIKANQQIGDGISLFSKLTARLRLNE